MNDKPGSPALAAWEDRVLAADPTRATCRVAYHLARYADADGGNAFPGVQRLAQVTRLAERTVIRALAWLRARGFVVRVSRSNRWRGLADVYRLVLTRARSHDIGGRPPEDRTTGRGRGSRPSPQATQVASALTHHTALTTRESQRVQARADRLIRQGTPEAVVLQAIRTPLPADVGSVAAVLHMRLIEVEKRGPDAGRWLSSLTTRIRRRVSRTRHTSTVPRTAADFGPESRALTSW